MEMKDRIEVGEYCRTKGGHIHKVTRIDDNELVYWGKIQCGWSLEQLEDIIVKHSKNIIDLIKVGDYVNGKLVYNSRYNELYIGFIYCGGIGVRTEEPYTTFIKEMREEDIESIVTKEQFEEMEYRVNE